jgi:hypothetical protein
MESSMDSDSAWDSGSRRSYSAPDDDDAVGRDVID